MSDGAETSEPPSTYIVGVPWPDFNDGLIYNDVVPLSHPGLTLTEYYSTKHKNSAPMQGWLQRIGNSQITVDGIVVTDPNTILRAGMELVYHRRPWKEPDAPFLLQVLFEDDDMIALNKPSGLQVLPGGLFQQRTVLTQLQWYSSKQNPLLKHKKLHAVPVHRLGRGTSGVLLCAKTKLAKSHLAAYFADGTSVVAGNRHINMELNDKRKISKIYRALTEGIINKDEVVITQPIGTIRYPGVAKGLYVASPSGKPALTKVEVLERNVRENHTLVKVEIQSGRPHQIRIHLSFIGHPLLGDPLYITGGRPKCFDSDFVDDGFALDGGYQKPVKPVPGDCGYHLHACQLVLPHPITNEVIEINAPIPSILQTQDEAKELCLSFGDNTDKGQN